ncbi:MAG: nitronate monooxygenase [Burkholderiaceae bacterium]
MDDAPRPAATTLPVIAAPMLLVSGIDYVVGACAAGIGGAFPTANCRDTDELDDWLRTMRRRIDSGRSLGGGATGDIWPNLIVHRSNPRRDADLRVLLDHGVKRVITSVGAPDPVLGPLHDAGCKVYADVASLRHAQRAITAGVDGLILLTAGAGGQTGWANPFAFARAVRTIWPGPMVLAGGVADGRALFAARTLGFDLAYMGTRMIATAESLASDDYKRMLVDSSLDDIVLTRAFTGLETNMLRASIVAAGLNPDALPAHGGLDAGRDLDANARRDPTRPRRWRDVWSAGHAVSSVNEVPPMATLVARLDAEYRAAARDAAAIAHRLAGS